jgi:hypothetical protein
MRGAPGAYYRVGGMLHRALDVVFQYLFRLIALLVAVPLAVAGIGFALDHSQTVQARVWAERPIYTPKFATDRFTSGDAPADIESGILRELLTTSKFDAAVLTRVDGHYPDWDLDRQDGADADLQQRVTVTTEGSHLFTVSYKTTQPDRGRVIVDAIIAAFGHEVETIDADQVSVTQAALQAQVDAAKRDMDDAVRQAQTYQLQHHAGLNDPSYDTLLAQAQSKTDRYLSLQGEISQAQGSQTAVSTLQSSFFHVVDQPFVKPFQLDTHSPAVKYAIYSVIGILGAEALFVYVIGRRDPRIRSVHDIRAAGAFKPLGTAPELGRR